MVPGYSQVTTFNTKMVNYTPSTSAPQPNPVDGDTTTEGNFAFIYADIVPCTVSMTNGNITSTSIGKVWTLRLSIPNAKNVGFTFTQFNLASNAEMYIFNESRTILKGGIKQEYFTTASNLTISSITGNAIIIYIVEKNNFGTFQSTIAFSEAAAGFEDIEDLNGTTTSASINSGDFSAQGTTSCFTPACCMDHIQCYPSKLNSARSVARISIPRPNNRIALCTGTLINNEANNGRAFLLTAFHCIDANDNRTLEQNEIDAFLRAGFQFQFWRATCGVGMDNRGIEFNGATLRASNRATDMALFELINAPGVGDNVNYAGWNRQTSPSSNSSSFIIHHPRGFNMRYTQTSQVKDYLFNSNYWQAYYSNGAVTRGSSGAGLFNENNQIIGQLRGGWSGCAFLAFSDRYGKIDRSWTGGGTNTTRLSNWLSPAQNLNSAGTLVTSALFVQGADQIGCSVQISYSVSIRLFEATYEWQTSSDLQIVSGQGTPSVVVRATTTGSTTNGVVTAIVRTPTKGVDRAVTLTKNVTVRTTTFNSSDYPVSGPSSACKNSDVSFSTNTLPGATNYAWFWPSDWTYMSGQGTPNLSLRTGTSSGAVGVRVANACGPGGSPGTRFVSVNTSCGFLLAPNPSTDEVTISSTSASSTAATKTTPKVKIYRVRLTDQSGNIRKQYSYASGLNSVTINVGDLIAGVYTVHIYNGKQWTAQKLIKQ